MGKGNPVLSRSLRLAAFTDFCFMYLQPFLDFQKNGGIKGGRAYKIVFVTGQKDGKVEFTIDDVI